MKSFAEILEVIVLIVLAVSAVVGIYIGNPGGYFYALLAVVYGYTLLEEKS